MKKEPIVSLPEPKIAKIIRPDALHEPVRRENLAFKEFAKHYFPRGD